MLEILINDLKVKPSISTKSSISDIAKLILPFCSYKYDFSNSTMIHEGDFIVFLFRISRDMSIWPTLEKKDASISFDGSLFLSMCKEYQKKGIELSNPCDLATIYPAS